MLGIKRTGLPFTIAHGTIDEHRQKSEVVQKTKVRILVDKSVARYIQSDRKQHGFISEKPKGNQVEMTFMSSNLEHGFSRWYLMFCDYAKILEPESLKIRVKEILKTAEHRLID